MKKVDGVRLNSPACRGEKDIASALKLGSYLLNQIKQIRVVSIGRLKSHGIISPNLCDKNTVETEFNLEQNNEK